MRSSPWNDPIDNSCVRIFNAFELANDTLYHVGLKARNPPSLSLPPNEIDDLDSSGEDLIFLGCLGKKFVLEVNEIQFGRKETKP